MTFFKTKAGTAILTGLVASALSGIGGWYLHNIHSAGTEALYGAKLDSLVAWEAVHQADSGRRDRDIAELRAEVATNRQMDNDQQKNIETLDLRLVEIQRDIKLLLARSTRNYGGTIHE